jgi:hypothetical protein
VLFRGAAIALLASEERRPDGRPLAREVWRFVCGGHRSTSMPILAFKTTLSRRRSFDGRQKALFTTPPSTLSAAPLVAEDSGLAT